MSTYAYISLHTYIHIHIHIFIYLYTYIYLSRNCYALSSPLQNNDMSDEGTKEMAACMLRRQIILHNKNHIGYGPVKETTQTVDMSAQEWKSNLNILWRVHYANIPKIQKVVHNISCGCIKPARSRLIMLMHHSSDN